MKCNRRSIIWRMDTVAFKKLVACSASYTEVLRHFGLVNHGNNGHTLKQRLEEENVGHHLKLWVQRKPTRTAMPLISVLVEHSTYSRVDLKRRLIEGGLLKNECAICTQTNTWQNKPLVLILDHINGISDDHRLFNLRLLCPNCNSQTDTFAGRNSTRKRKTYNCISCLKIRDRNSLGLCRSCSDKSKRRFNVAREDLVRLVWERPMTKIATDLGVSDVAVAKRCRLLGVSVPSRGYWAKKYANTL